MGIFFFDYIDLPYHFGMLKMSTLCTFQCFFTTAHQISAIETNVSVLFFQTGLIRWLWNALLKFIISYTYSWRRYEDNSIPKNSKHAQTYVIWFDRKLVHPWTKRPKRLESGQTQPNSQVFFNSFTSRLGQIKLSKSFPQYHK